MKGFTLFLLSIAVGLACLARAEEPLGVVQDRDAPPNAESEQPPLLESPLPMVPDAQLPLADPVLKGDAMIRGNRATVWSQGDVRYILLDGDVSVAVGGYGFEGGRAVVRIDTQTLPGRSVRHISAYFDHADAMAGEGPVQASSPRLLVTVSTTGKVRLSTDLGTATETAPDDPLVEQAEQRFTAYRAALARPLLPAPDNPIVSEAALALRDARREQIAGRRQMIQAEAVALAERTLAQSAERTGDLDREVLPTRGAVLYSVDNIVYQPTGDGRSAIMLIGDAKLAYEDPADNRSVALRAERIVLFIEGELDDLPDGAIPADRVLGVYLEDDVMATSDGYTIRAPRVYYDLPRNRAVILDAVLFAYDVERDIPLYVRADLVRQTSASSFSAERALITTSEFGVPHFAIGAGRVTLDQVKDEEGNRRNMIHARDITPRFGGIPFAWWPVLAGEATDMPLRQLKPGYSENNGPEIQTTWDLFALAGRVPPDGVSLEGNLDYFGEHGPGLGSELDYDLPNLFGSFDAYLIPYEMGTDDLGEGRNDVDREGDTRGYLRAQHRQYLDFGIEASIEIAYVSDETFLEEYFRSQADTAKEYETSFYLKKQENDWALTLLGRYDLTDFTPQLTTLQSPGYTVDKLPEVALFMIGRSLLEEHATYFGQTSVSRMMINFGDDTPGDRGFTAASSAAVFGIAPNQPFSDRFPGIPTNWVARVDSRHEIDVPLSAGPIDITPYVVGRVTAYDQDFQAFSGETDQVRLWGQAGTRLSTRFHRVYNAENELLDINRLQHIVEPMVNLYASGTTIDLGDLPVFDSEVESLQQGYGVSLGVRNTFQTQRGQGAQRRGVDWLIVDTRYLFAFDEVGESAALPRYFDYRPEYSIGGDHFFGRALWMVTDAVGATGELTWSADSGNIAQWRVHLATEHTPRLATYIGYEEIEVLESRLLSAGFTYQLTTKYALGVAHVYDFGADESRRLEAVLERRLPRWRARLVANIDTVDNDTFFGFELRPEGLSGTGSLGLR